MKVIRTLSVAGALSVAGSAHAADIGGHIGLVLPLASASASSTSTIADGVVVGMPTGVGFAVSERVAIDFETVSFLNTETRSVSFMAHPGVIVGLGSGFALGGRFGAEFESGAWGPTALLNKGWEINERAKWFIEGVVPVRFVPTGGGDTDTVVTFAFHSGIAI